MTAERKASELLREPNTSRAMVRAMAKLGRVQDDCGLLDEPDDLPEQRPTPKQSAAVIQLPLWPEPARGAPNDVLRSALFAAIQGKGREFITPIFAGRISTYFKGLGTDQANSTPSAI